MTETAIVAVAFFSFLTILTVTCLITEYLSDRKEKSKCQKKP
jgi:putative effector of murein hydrolase LrgA (UPF0299 family)